MRFSFLILVIFGMMMPSQALADTAFTSDLQVRTTDPTSSSTYYANTKTVSAYTFVSSSDPSKWPTSISLMADPVKIGANTTSYGMTLASISFPSVASRYPIITPEMTTVPYYQFSFDTRALADGEHMIYVQATDAQAKKAAGTSYVLKVDNNGPTVLAPQLPVIDYQPNFNISYDDANGSGVTKYELFLNDKNFTNVSLQQLFKVTKSTSSYKVDWKNQNQYLPAGAYSLRWLVEDKKGHKTEDSYQFASSGGPKLSNTYVRKVIKNKQVSWFKITRLRAGLDVTLRVRILSRGKYRVFANQKVSLRCDLNPIKIVKTNNAGTVQASCKLVSKNLNLTTSRGTVVIPF